MIDILSSFFPYYNDNWFFKPNVVYILVFNEKMVIHQIKKRDFLKPCFYTYLF